MAVGIQEIIWRCLTIPSEKLVQQLGVIWDSFWTLHPQTGSVMYIKFATTWLLMATRLVLTQKLYAEWPKDIKKGKLFNICLILPIEKIRFLLCVKLPQQCNAPSQTYIDVLVFLLHFISVINRRKKEYFFRLFYGIKYMTDLKPSGQKAKKEERSSQKEQQEQTWL